MTNSWESEWPRISERVHAVRQKAEAIWTKPLLRHYTYHDIGHAERVMDILYKLQRLIHDRLTCDEVYVLLCAALLHDIGMQDARFLEKQAIKKRYTEEEIATAKCDDQKRDKMIREWHHLIGEERILREPGVVKCIESEFIDQIARVARGHTREDLDTYEDETKAGSDMRVRLLAALLRLADELDLDFRRVNLDELDQAVIPRESKAHWWKCHCVDSVDVHIDGRIQIVFRFSEDDSEEVIDIVPMLVMSKLRREMHEERLKDILWPYVRLNLDEGPKVVRRGVGKRPVPEDVVPLFKEELDNLTLRRAFDSIKPVAAHAKGSLMIAFGEVPENLKREAVELLRQGKRDQASTVLQRATSLYPASGPLQALLADQLIHLGCWEDAEEAAHRAVESDPSNVLGRLTLGIVLNHRGDYEGALSHLWITDLASRLLEPAYRVRQHSAMAESLAGLGDYWYARERVQTAGDLVGGADIQAVERIETKLSDVSSTVEHGLRPFRIVEGRWKWPDLKFIPVIGRWTRKPPFRYETHARSDLPEGILLSGCSSWMDYIFDCEFQLLNLAAGFYIRADAWGTSGIMMQFNPRKLRRHQRLHSNYAAREISEVDLPKPLGIGKWHKVRFEISGSRLKTWLDDRPVDDWTDFMPEYMSGKVGFRLWGREFALYRAPGVTVTKMAISNQEKDKTT